MNGGALPQAIWRLRVQPPPTRLIRSATPRPPAEWNPADEASYDVQAVCWKESLRENAKFAWKHSNAATHVWSGDALSYLASLSDEHYDDVRLEYGAQRRTKSSN